MEGDAAVAGHIDAAAEIHGGVEHRQGLVLRHVDLVQHAEASHLRALVDGPFPEGYLPVGKGVGAQEGGGVGVDVKGHVPAGAAEGGCQVFCQYVLAGGLGAGEQQVFPAEEGRGGLLPDILSVIKVAGFRYPAFQGAFRRPFCPEPLNFCNDFWADALVFQEVQHGDLLPVSF